MQAHSTLYLSGLRGFAAFLAVNAHDAWLYQNGDYSKTFGFAGVDLFFVLSSFLLTRGLYHQMISFINQEKSFSQWIQMLKIYFIRRFARIYPFFVYVVLLNIILAQMFKTDTALSNYFTWFGGRENFINISWKIVTFMEAPAFFWTLVIEVQYYFLIPVIVAVAVFSKKFWWIPVTILLLISTIMNFNVKRVNDNATIFEHCWTFLTGSCFALFVARLEELSMFLIVFLFT